MPTRKVGAGGLASMVCVVAIWALKQFGGVDLPPEVAAAVTGVAAFALSYLVPEAREISE